MKTIYKYFNNLFLISILACGSIACSGLDPMDDYKKFLEGGEISYTGRVDSVKSFSGRSRLKLSMLLVSDPNITKIRSYWNNGMDSVEVSVNRGTGVDTVHFMLENLIEGGYNFEIITLDDIGNRSVPVTASGKVYGEKYEATLLSTPIISSKWYNYADSAIIELGGKDQFSLGERITYMDKEGQERKVILEKDTDWVHLENYKQGTEVYTQTMFMPEPTALDTFYSAKNTSLPEKTLVLFREDLDILKNSGSPVEYDTWDGNRWGIPKNWEVNETVKNMDGYGGFDGYKGHGYIAMEKWNSGHSPILNGKIYQSVTLPAGEYAFMMDFDSRNVKDEAYIIVAKGMGLPDVDQKDNAIAYEPLKDNKEVRFVLDQEMTISVGFLAWYEQDKQNFRAHNLKIQKLEWK